MKTILDEKREIRQHSCNFLIHKMKLLQKNPHIVEIPLNNVRRYTDDNNKELVSYYSTCPDFFTFVEINNNNIENVKIVVKKDVETVRFVTTYIDFDKETAEYRLS